MVKQMASAKKSSNSFSSFIFLTTLRYYLYHGLFACNLLSQAALGEIASPSELTGIVGQDVIFHFKTTGKNPIKAAKFGLYNGSDEEPSPKFITVLHDRKGNFREICGNDLNDPAAARYKNRVLFEGNLNEGHASFRIKSLTLNDANLYLCKIREDSDEDYKPNRIKLIVLEKETTPPTKVSEIKYKDFEGVANKTCRSYRCFNGEKKLIVYDALKKAYGNMPIKYKIKMKSIRKVNRKVTAWFHINLAEAVNRSYAYSFLETAQRNNQLNGYNITCFEKLDVKPNPADKIKPSKLSPWLIAVFVIIGLIVLVLVIVGVILYKFYPELVQPFITLLRDLRRRLRELVCNISRALIGRRQ